MAREAGIKVPAAGLVHDGERRHFVVQRFDRELRDGGWRRKHVHTLSGLLHRKAADGAIDYADFMRLARALAGAEGAVECFRRAVFNLLATNRDDHGRNHAFLCDEGTRTWTLSPAYDLNPNVANVLIAMRWLDQMAIPTRWAEVQALAEIGGITPKLARQVYGEVVTAVDRWPAIARAAGVPRGIADFWRNEMLQQTKALRADAKAAL